MVITLFKGIVHIPIPLQSW